MVSKSMTTTSYNVCHCHKITSPPGGSLRSSSFVLGTHGHPFHSQPGEFANLYGFFFLVVGICTLDTHGYHLHPQPSKFIIRCGNSPQNFHCHCPFHSKRPGNSCNLQILVKCQSQSLYRFCSVFGIMHLIFSTMYGSWYLVTRCHVSSKMLINCQQVTKMGYKDMRGAIEETIGEKKSQETDEEILQIYHQCE